MKMRFAVVVERVSENYSAYVPDLPGCVAAAAIQDETEQLIREAIRLHIDGLRGDDDPVTERTSIAEYVEA
ncbi:MAG TPA: type II toxin-antitoxin system HicB family antitoxin [Dehalococcoidia bacterium]|jgi:predicted RNase H-like HicB family nuclease